MTVYRPLTAWAEHPTHFCLLIIYDKNHTRSTKKKEKTISYSVQTDLKEASMLLNATFKHNPTYCIFKLPQKYFTSYY